MTSLVTGATGFVGGHVVRALCARGEPVRCLVRPGRSTEHLDGLGVAVVAGDLSDPTSLPAAVEGCDYLFHCAADYRFFARDPAELYRVNVDGTDALLAAAAAASVKRVVYTSSVGALASGLDQPADEDTPVDPKRLIGHYKKSKYAAERIAEGWAARGLPVIIVNPSTPVGERDVKPTPTGQMIVDFLKNRLPAFVDTGLNFIDVSDVALGHLLAAERGRVGERYILGSQNLSLQELLIRLAELTGRPAPRIRLPHWVPIAVAALDTGWARLSGRPPRVALEAARIARHRMYFDASKAVRDLGFSPGPIEPALDRAVHWFKTHGYA